MLDKRSNALLLYIVSQCEEGAFKVIDANDMIKAFPKKFKINQDNISQIIKYLTQHEYIVVKHSDENFYCLAPLPKARLKHEKDNQEKRYISKLKKMAIIIILLSFIFSFIGAFLGAYIVRLFW